MRRFESRSKAAPMDYTYESPNRIPSSSPFRAAMSRTDSRNNASSTTSPRSPHFQSDSPSWAFGAFDRASTPFSFSSPAPASADTTNSQWIPPPNFSPERAFSPTEPLPAPEAEMADGSMTTATPDASPSPLARQAARGRSIPPPERGGELSIVSPLRRSAFKTRDRDRSRERERAIERRRGMSRSQWDDGDSADEDGRGRSVVADSYHVHLPAATMSHGDLPYVLSGYLQLFFNLSLLLGFLYCLIAVIGTVRLDVEEKVAEYSSTALRDIAHCTKLYLTNKCNPETRIPHMESVCREWEECMNQDPSVVGHARVAAETFAQVVNSFVEEISWKTLAFTLVSLAFFIVFTNTVLSVYRSRHAPVSQLPPGIAGNHGLVNAHQLAGLDWTAKGWPLPRDASVQPETPQRRKPVDL